MNESDLFQAMLPYAGTSGWSGSDTSRARAVNADGDGTTLDRHRETIGYVMSQTWRGVTWRELADRMGWHHGTASGVLSVLHKEGLLSRLTEKRDKCKVYVFPTFVAERETEQQGRKHECPECGHRF